MQHCRDVEKLKQGFENAVATLRVRCSSVANTTLVFKLRWYNVAGTFLQRNSNDVVATLSLQLWIILIRIDTQTTLTQRFLNVENQLWQCFKYVTAATLVWL